MCGVEGLGKRLEVLKNEIPGPSLGVPCLFGECAIRMLNLAFQARSLKFPALSGGKW